MTMFSLTKRPILGAAAAAMAVIALASCSSGTTASTANQSNPMSTASMGMHSSSPASATAGTIATGPHNDADISFATNMIPHHAQAIQMSALAAGQASNAEVKSLATAIEKAQQPEIAQMSSWLLAWGKPVPDLSMSGMGGMGTTNSGTGMMSDADMTALGGTAGAAFDRMWVTMMLAHHKGAVTMATTELSQGMNTQAQALAHSIITSQSAQIVQLQQLLAKLPA